MKKSNEAIEIEQLKNKIEQYRKALASLKSEDLAGDIQLKRRVASLEKNMEKLNEQVEELVQLFHEGFTSLSDEMKELAKKQKEHLVEKKETVKPWKEPARFEQPEHPHSALQQYDVRSNSQKNTLPSFSQLKQLAQQPTIQINEPSKSKYNTPRYYTPAVPLEHVGIRELEPNVHEEKKPPSNGGTVDTSVMPLTVQTSRALQESKEPQPIHRVNQLYGSEENEASPFWKMFKKK